MTAARTRQMAPTAAPQQLPTPMIQPQYFASPPHAPYDYTPESGAGYSPPAVEYLDGAMVERLLSDLRNVIDRNPNMMEEVKRTTIDAHFENFEHNVHEEIQRLRKEFFARQGLQPGAPKRPHDSDDDGSPEVKRPRPGEEEDDEVNTKGTWRCLYYEEQPEQHVHCKDKRYKRVSELRRHIKTHTLPHHCSKCGYRTAEERRLHGHKCDPANLRKYSPVTEEERLKHEQLARMGIKVGQMRMILFGKKSDADENGAVDDDSGDSEELPPSRTPSFMNVQQMSQQPLPQQYVVTFPPFQQSVMAPQDPLNLVTMAPNTPMTMAPNNPMTMAPDNQMYTAPQMPMHPMHMTTPPFNPGSPHSPFQGHAATYYYSQSNPNPQNADFLLYPQSHGSSSPPGNHTPPEHFSIQPYADPVPGLPRTDSLNRFLQDVIPEGIPEVRERSMPKEEIEAMEENLRKQEKEEKERQRKQEKEEKERQRQQEKEEKMRKKGLSRALSTTWGSRISGISVTERSRNFFRSFSTRSKANSDGDSPKRRSRQQSAPPELNGETRLSPSDQEEKKEEGGVVASIKKIFWIGVGRKRPSAVAAVATSPVTVAAATGGGA